MGNSRSQGQGRPAYDFAYPKAVAGSPEVVRLVRERFRSATHKSQSNFRRADTQRARSTFVP